MLGLDEYRKTEMCPRCGGPKWICQSPKAQEDFEAGAPARCYLTTMTADAQHNYLAQDHDPYEQALSWPLKVRQASAG